MHPLTKQYVKTIQTQHSFMTIKKFTIIILFPGKQCTTSIDRPSYSVTYTCLPGYGLVSSYIGSTCGNGWPKALVCGRYIVAYRL